MKNLKVVLIVCCLIVSLAGCGKEQEKEVEMDDLLMKPVFIDAQEGAKILSQDDDFTTALSQFDHMSRFKVEGPLTVEERKNIYDKHTLEWTNEEKTAIINAFNTVGKKIKELNLNLPKEIKFILTDGQEESDAAYTREDYIIFPKGMLDGSMPLDYVVAHEIFHVFSRYNIESKKDIYAVFGFKECDNLVLPDELAPLKITNPDAPLFNTYIECNYQGKKQAFIPITFGDRMYDIEKNDGFFNYLQQPLIAVTLDGNKPIPVIENNKLVLIAKDDLEDYYTQIGRNTEYTLHPEEISADNFALFILGAEMESKEKNQEFIKVIQQVGK